MLDNNQITKMLALGHEPIPERDAYRHVAFKKTLPSDLPVKHKGGALLLSSGKPLLCGDVLPERADVALDGEGNTLPQYEFRERYMVYLAGLQTDRNPQFEHVPDVSRYVTRGIDVHGGGRGYVEIGFDPNATGPPVETKAYAPTGEKRKDYTGPTLSPEEVADAQKNSSFRNNEKESEAQLLHKLHARGKLGDDDLADELAALFGVPNIQPDDPVAEAAESGAASVAAEVSAPAPSPEEPKKRKRRQVHFTTVQTPCGRLLKKPALHLHVAKCKEEECVTAQAAKEAEKAATGG